MASSEPTAAPATSDGQLIDLTTCEDEPIHIPGSIQPWAALLVADVDGTVVSASVNLGQFVAVEPSDALGRDWTEVVGADDVAAPGGLLGSNRSTRPLLTVDSPAGLLHLGVHHHDDRVLVAIERVEVPEAGPTEGLVEGTAAILAGLYGTRDLDDLMETACRVVAGVTGFDRVMAYRFEHDDHGVVVAEAAAEGIDSFLGLHYPASDIPAQARRMYLEHWLRLIPDIDYRPVSLEPPVDPAGRPIDLAAVVARSVSPIHLQYLRNMGVRASMSISLVSGGRLWGLLACHHYGGARPMTAGQRAISELVGLTVSNLIEARARAIEAERRADVDAALVAVLDDVTAATTLSEGLLSRPDTLRRICGADGVAVRVNGAVTTDGSVPPADVVSRVIAALADRPDGGIHAVDSIDDLIGAGDGWAGGVLALALARAQGNYLLWFRDEWRRSVTWAGDPTEAVKVAAGTERLLPRSSFEAWTETVDRHCRPWTDGDLDAGGRLRSSLGTFLLARAEQLAELNSELARSNAELDSFAHVAAHDLKEPLRGVFNYVSFVEEDYGGLLDEAGRDQLATIQRLVERMNALLDTLLEYSRVGRAELDVHTVPLGELVDEAVELVRTRVTERSAEVFNRCRADVRGDRPLLRTVLMNLVSNAVKYNDGDHPRIEVDLVALADTELGTSMVDPVSSSTNAMVEPMVVRVSDDGIGVPEDRRDEVFEVFRRLHPRDRYGGGTGAGLTVARRIVERHGGRIWMESSPLGGTSVLFTVEVA